MLMPNVFKEGKMVHVKLFRNRKTCGEAYLTEFEINQVESKGYEVIKLIK